MVRVLVEIRTTDGEGIRDWGSGISVKTTENTEAAFAGTETVGEKRPKDSSTALPPYTYDAYALSTFSTRTLPWI